ncbi:signal recognition particle protein Srp19, partial [Candidatus Woesearchaeota archaeon]
LAKFFQKRGFKVAMVQLDVWRPAAYEQLKQLGAKINVPVFGNPSEKNPAKIWEQFQDAMQTKEFRDVDVLIVDTAGRDALSDELIQELSEINSLVKPHETLLVMGADVGQAAEKQAQAFHDTVNVTGVIITKLDGTAKGGGALVACSITDAPVKFIGVGERIDDLEEFKPKNFVSRLLGMGDLETLLEKAKEAIDEDQAEDLGRKMLKGEFNLIDLYQQMEAMSKMGPLGKIMEMIPGMGQLKLPKEALKVQEDKLKRWKHMMNSMTKDELEDPEKVTGSRAERVARGSGTSVSEVRELIKQYKQSKKLMKMLKGGSERNMQKLMQKFQSGQVKFR